VLRRVVVVLLLLRRGWRVVDTWLASREAQPLLEPREVVRCHGLAASVRTVVTAHHLGRLAPIDVTQSHPDDAAADATDAHAGDWWRRRRWGHLGDRARRGMYCGGASYGGTSRSGANCSVIVRVVVPWRVLQRCGLRRCVLLGRVLQLCVLPWQPLWRWWPLRP
tara:strand:- start:120 stop:614 length:495 start_codon:yes stop_codon:yes gene_type:complete